MAIREVLNVCVGVDGAFWPEQALCSKLVKLLSDNAFGIALAKPNGAFVIFGVLAVLKLAIVLGIPTIIVSEQMSGCELSTYYSFVPNLLGQSRLGGAAAAPMLLSVILPTVYAKYQSGRIS